MTAYTVPLGVVGSFDGDRGGLDHYHISARLGPSLRPGTCLAPCNHVLHSREAHCCLHEPLSTEEDDTAEAATSKLHFEGPLHAYHGTLGTVVAAGHHYS